MPYANNNNNSNNNNNNNNKITTDIRRERRRLCKDIDMDKRKSFLLYLKISASLPQRLQIK